MAEDLFLKEPSSSSYLTELNLPPSAGSSFLRDLETSEAYRFYTHRKKKRGSRNATGKARRGGIFTNIFEDGGERIAYIFLTA